MFFIVICILHLQQVVSASSVVQLAAFPACDSVIDYINALGHHGSSINPDPINYKCMRRDVSDMRDIFSDIV